MKIIDELFKIINEILPLVAKDEAERIRERLDKLEKEREVVNGEILDALRRKDYGAVNLIISELLSRL